jgi:DNA-binding XRE family transcriptional regulator
MPLPRSRWRRGGRYLPSLPLAFAIARFFDMTVDKMFDPADEEEGA